MATKMIGSGRPMRRCAGYGVGCGQTDDHPKHLMESGLGDDDPAFHLDCHAAMGCQSCRQQVNGADGKTGGDMLDHVLANATTPDTTSEEG